MVTTSTPFLTYGEINTETTDLYDDAWGLASEFHDVLSKLGEIDTSPADRMARELILYLGKVY